MGATAARAEIVRGGGDMGRFQERVTAEREAIVQLANDHYAVVPPQNRAAKLDRETIDALDARRVALLIEEFSATYVGRTGAQP